MAVKHGRFGAFLGCTKFPECRTTRPIVKDIGVACPVCEKPVVERKTKTGRLFYGCSDYPACNFISWNKPTNEPCPVCGTFMVEKKYKNQLPIVECSNNDCPTRIGQKKTETDAIERPLEKRNVLSKTGAAAVKKAAQKIEAKKAPAKRAPAKKTATIDAKSATASTLSSTKAKSKPKAKASTKTKPATPQRKSKTK